MTTSERVQQECIRFFRENRYSFMTLQQLSLALGRSAQELNSALNTLIREGRVEASFSSDGREQVYRSAR